ncbi:MAG: asparagine synthase (glutamine-hydrolyzing), partial [Nitrospira sp.]
MCGIAGIVHSDQSQKVPQELVKAMCDRIVHRGPDDFGVFTGGHVGLGMRRLTIIDLHTGHQPIANEDKTVWIVFNGEVYNYRALRDELQRKGHQFSTATDTEVIIHLYEEEGRQCVERLRGMFAFAIWDVRKQVLLLARDRVGIKPLYYSESPEGLVFGSELRAILAVEGINKDVSPQAVAEYFTHLCVPGNLSIYKSVKKLPPGHVLTFHGGKSDLFRYWSPSVRPDFFVKESDWVDQLRSCLTDAVTSHMVADVPLGAFLSGGVDSGAMVSIMARQSSVPVRTFTVGFKSGSGQFDETAAARAVVTQYGTRHHE